MNDDTISEELERRLSRSLRAVAPRPEPGLADRLLSRTATAPQRRVWGGLGWLPTVAISTAVVAIAVVVGLQLGNLLSRNDGSGIGSSAESIGPSPSLTSPPEVSPAPSHSGAPAANECTNEEFGFTVSYPAEWWANPEIPADDPALNTIMACTYFAEEPVDIPHNAGLPAAVSISVASFVGPPEDAPITYGVVGTEETRVGGLDATIEEIEYAGATPLIPAGTRSYGYHVELPSGETIIFNTSSTATQGDYDDHKRVLDEMMRSFELTVP